jgi:signal transduction histidine kinase
MSEENLRELRSGMSQRLLELHAHEIGNICQTLRMNLDDVLVSRGGLEKARVAAAVLGETSSALLGLSKLASTEAACLTTDLVKRALRCVESGIHLHDLEAINLVDQQQVLVREADVVFALITILGNATKAHPRKGTPREITIRSKTKEGMAGIAIEDNGYGFTDEALVKATEPGFTTTRGKGWGLYFASQVAELNIANRPEGGAQVILWLPTVVE